MEIATGCDDAKWELTRSGIYAWQLVHGPCSRVQLQLADPNPGHLNYVIRTLRVHTALRIHYLSCQGSYHLFFNILCMAHFAPMFQTLSCSELDLPLVWMVVQSSRVVVLDRHHVISWSSRSFHKTRDAVHGCLPSSELSHENIDDLCPTGMASASPHQLSEPSHHHLGIFQHPNLWLPFEIRGPRDHPSSASTLTPSSSVAA